MVANVGTWWYLVLGGTESVNIGIGQFLIALDQHMACMPLYIKQSGDLFR